MNINDMPLTTVLGVCERRYTPLESQPSANLAVNTVLCGVEIEMENVKSNGNNWARIYDYWKEEEEHSLENGKEIVINPPRNGTHLEDAINAFFDSGVTYTGGERTSIHIHVDMLDGTTVGQLRAMYVLAYILEGAIYRVADEHRKWGGYSQPLTDMRPSRMNKILCGVTPALFHAGIAGAYHEEKYYGFNCASLVKHGTMEFRYFPCTDDKEQLYTWINICTELKQAAMAIGDVCVLTDGVSTEDGLVQMLNTHMPRSAGVLLRYLDRPYAVEAAETIKTVISDNISWAAGKDPVFVKSKIITSMERRLLLRDKLPGSVDEAPPAIKKPARRKAVPEAELVPAGLIGPDGQVNKAAYEDLIVNIARARGNLNR